MTRGTGILAAFLALGIASLGAQGQPFDFAQGQHPDVDFGWHFDDTGTRPYRANTLIPLGLFDVSTKVATSPKTNP